MWENGIYYDASCEAKIYNFVIAGHTHATNKKSKLGILKHENGNLLKPLNKDDIRSTREFQFYTDISKNAEFDPILNDLKKFIPLFYGTWKTTINNCDVTYLCIEDICGPFQNPSVLDVKIGAITYDPIASVAKIKEETEKYPPSTVIGFRILGMKIYDGNLQTYIFKGKDFGKKLMPENIQTGFEMTFCSHLGQINCLILSGFIHKLLQLKQWFSVQRKYAFYSSSILFAYESNVSSWATWVAQYHLHIANTNICKKNEDSLKNFTLLHNKDCNLVLSVKESNKFSEKKKCEDCNLDQEICKNLQDSCKLFRIAMIDFAHVFPSSKEDSNYVLGLNNLITNFQLLMKSFIETYL